MTGQEKTLLRTIYFYKIAISMQCLETYAYEYTKKKLLKEVLDSIGSTYSVSDEKNIIIETIENTDTYYFASIGKLENSKNTILTRFRTPTMEKRPYSLPGNSLLEMYTYFYLDYETGYIAVLDNNEAPKPPRYLQSLFSKELAGKFSGTVKVYPIRMKDVGQYLHKFQKLNEISFTFANAQQGTDKYLMPTLRELSNHIDADVSRLKVTLKLDECPVSHTLLKHILSWEQADGFSDVFVKGEYMNSNVSDVVDIFKRSLTRRVRIPLAEDELIYAEKDMREKEKTIQTILQHNLLTDVIGNAGNVDTGE